MGYFTRLRARARNLDGWSGYKYTGSASAGADLVSEDTWCVVYAADVNYQGTEENIKSLSLSTNFVNPLSSGNPCTVSCYMYTFDPTGNGNASVDAPPAGFYSAVSKSFEASTVGDYVTFSFGTTGIRPAQVYFWFTSTVSYESYGSNSVYHYATGNYDSSLATGTKTPQLTAGFEGTDTGAGGGTGGSGGAQTGTYRAVASGSYADLYTKWDFAYTRTQRDASYTALSFKSGGSVSFACKHSGGGDSYLQMRCYLSTGSGLDTASGTPADSIIASVSGGDSLSFSATVASGQTYYLWTVIDYCGTSSVPLSVEIDPGSWSYNIADKGSQLNLDRAEKNFTMSMGQFQTGRMHLSFAYSAGVDISVSASDGAFAGVLYVSDKPDIDSSTGMPMSILSSFNAGSSSFLNVVKGKSYYFFAIFNGGSSSGSISFRITAPPVLWYLGGLGNFSLLAANKSVSVSLSSFRYYQLQVSFAHTGKMRISCSNASVGDGEIWLYYGEGVDIDSSNGLAIDWEDTYSGKSIDVSIDVIAGKTYRFIIRNSMPSSSLTGTFTVIPPSFSQSYTKALEGYSYVEGDVSEGQSLLRYSYSEKRLRFKYRGEAIISVSRAAGEGGTMHLRAYLAGSSGINTQSGVATGTLLASYTGEGESFTLSCTVESERDYYLYIVSSEVYSATEGRIYLTLDGPEQRFFSLSETGEYYGISGSLSHSAAPGESGVLRLELNFAAGGIAKISIRPKNSASLLCAYLAHTPYLDSRSGAPYEFFASAEGSGTDSTLSINLSVSKNGSYYLFVRCAGVYDSAEFDVDLSCVAAAVNIYMQGKFLRAQPFVYHEGMWYAASPMCRKENAWNSGA